MDFQYAGFGLDVTWSRLPDAIKSVAVGAGRSGPMVFYSRFDEPASFRLGTTGLFISSVRSSAPFEVSIGNMSKIFDGRRQAIIVHGPGLPATSAFSGPFEGEFVSMSPESIERVLGSDQTYEIPSSLDELDDDCPARHLLATIRVCLASHHDVDPFAYEALLQALVRLVAVRDVSAKRAPYLSVDQACTVRAMILQGLAEPLGVGDLARAANLSEGHFSRAFKETFGASPYQYILRERVALAGSLILDKRGSLESIALKAGFTNVAQMTRALKMRSGHTSRAMRAAQRRAEMEGSGSIHAATPNSV